MASSKINSLDDDQNQEVSVSSAHQRPPAGGRSRERISWWRELPRLPDDTAPRSYFSFMTMLMPSAEDQSSLARAENNALALTATNMGPIGVTLYNTIGASFPWWRRRAASIGLLNPLPRFPDWPGQFNDAAGPFAGGLPKKIEVGEQFAVYFVPDHETLASEKIDRIGFTDTFGRFHWAPRRDLAKARTHIREECAKVGKPY